MTQNTRLLPYAQLVRLPNVFTAWADIVMGYMFTHWVLGLSDIWPIVLLLAVSTSLYWYGMVLNDLSDVRIDRRERPGRPLPSRRISLHDASRIARLLAISGVMFAVAASIAGGPFAWATAGIDIPMNPRPLIIAVLLLVTIRAYNRRFKHHKRLGPVTMGLCRTLNVLLGMSLIAGNLPLTCFFVAATIGFYIGCVTFLAQIEADPDLSNASAQRHIERASRLILVALLGPVVLMAIGDSDVMQIYPMLRHGNIFIIVSCIAPLFAYSMGQLFRAGETMSRQVQAAVKRSIFGLVVLDACYAYMVQGPIGLLILVLIVPAILLGRWLYST